MKYEVNLHDYYNIKGYKGKSEKQAIKFARKYRDYYYSITVIDEDGERMDGTLYRDYYEYRIVAK